jgi:hypothetical protein
LSSESFVFPSPIKNGNIKICRTVILPVAGPYENVKKLLGSIKGGKFLD